MNLKVLYVLSTNRPYSYKIIGEREKQILRFI